MFSSFSGAEVLTIAVIALVVFGPHRLPEIARTIGGYLRELRGAVIELRRGLEQEIGPIREPIKEIREEISKPVSEVRRTLAQTADTAKSAEQDIKRSLRDPSSGAPPPSTSAISGTGSSRPENPRSDRRVTTEAKWIAPQPPTGVSPKEVWEGMEDPLPDTVHPPASDDTDPPEAEDNQIGTISQGEDPTEEPTEKPTEKPTDEQEVS